MAYTFKTQVLEDSCGVHHVRLHVFKDGVEVAMTSTAYNTPLSDAFLDLAKTRADDSITYLIVKEVPKGVVLQ